MAPFTTVGATQTKIIVKINNIIIWKCQQEVSFKRVPQYTAGEMNWEHNVCPGCHQGREWSTWVRKGGLVQKACCCPAVL